ncbi:dimethylarginine dimethylaminohydrolase family protein [Oceanobacillus caeni]|uniref:dimethylarginine dimethylaminohydrolase family protein n=1 Tax=Oceanobacillus caeni TaxID=405946 RepID=UPI00363B577A
MENSTLDQNFRISCFNEYDPLKHVIVVPPNFMKITDVINVTQRHYIQENINTAVAMKQHTHFIETLKNEGIHVISFEPKKELNEQVFTRDIGFTLGNKFFLAALNKDLRKPESNVLKEWLDERKIPFHQIQTKSIEGGDVIVDNNKVWVGVSNRTTLPAIHHLQTILSDFQVIPVPIRKDILHLDCSFNIISPDTAIIFKPGINESSLKDLQQHYHLIDVTEEEQFSLGPNVLSIGNKKLISISSNKRLNKELSRRGFDVKEVEFSEIIKSGGSFRCCTLPLVRG